MNAAHSPLVGSLRTATGCQVAAWLALSLACRNLWPEGREGVFWGGLIMAGNLYVMRLVVRLALGRLAKQQQSAASLGAAATLPLVLLGSKFVLLLGATAAVMKWAQPNPLGLVAGFATLLAGIAGAAVHVASHQQGARSPWTTTPPG